MLLTEDSLGKRQQELNAKVKKASLDNVPFDEVKDAAENSDIDRLFKIDLASKYRNVEYLIEILKSGDSLCITRVLKYTWLYSDEYSDRLHPDFLHHNIFPFMSTKMTKKFLTAISSNVRNEKRAQCFYDYCINTNMPNSAFKFLIFTSEDFKLEVIKNKFEDVKSLHNDDNIKFFIGINTKLAESYLQKLNEWETTTTLCNFNYFFSVNPSLYLNWLEKYCDPSLDNYRRKFLGLRISKDILKKYKDRVLNHTKLYVKILHKAVLVKHTSVAEAKLYLTAMLPEQADKFWDNNFCESNKFLLDLIPVNEKYEFIKQIFTEHYPDNKFEMTKNFYLLGYYSYMTKEQKEAWALHHLANPNKTILQNSWSNNSEDLDYLWYRFVSFEKALVEMKKLLLITPDANKRAKVMHVLIESAQNQRELEMLFNYYYQRHINESRLYKEDFILKALQHHNIFEVDGSCWTAFNKLLYSIEVYNPAESNMYHRTQMFLQPALIYHIINNKEIPQALLLYVDSNISLYSLKSYIDQLNTEKKEMVYQYLLKSRVDKIKSFDDKDYNNEELKKEVWKHISFIKELNNYFEKPKEIDIDVVTKYMKLESEHTPNEENSTVTVGQLIRFLKQDPKLVIDKIPAVKQTINRSSILNLNTFLKKLRIYFSNDIAQDYLNFFMELLSEKSDYRSVLAAVYGVFQLADETCKSEFMAKYVPTDPKVDHSKIDRTHLYIQEGICRFACYSRPPVPLASVLLYVKGDYVKYCLPMFSMYLANLPTPSCIQFVESLLDAPVSVQKHGLRLAFKCFNIDNLKKLIHQVWKRSKNITLRMIIYKSLFAEVMRIDETTQAELFELLLTLTSDLHENDHEDTIELITNCNQVAPNLTSRYLESCWSAVSKFPENTRNLVRSTAIIQNMKQNLQFMNKSVIRGITDNYFNERLTLINMVPSENKTKSYEGLIDAKFDLALTLIANCNDEDDLKFSLKYVEFVTNKCLEMWHESHKNSKTQYQLYFAQVYFHNFINKLINKQYCNFINKLVEKQYSLKVYSPVNPIIKMVLQKLQDALRVQEIYMLIWKLRLVVVTNEILNDFVKLEEAQNSDTDVVKCCIKKYATEVNRLVEEYVDKKMFNISFLSEIGQEVAGNIKEILNINLHYRKNSLQWVDAVVFASEELIDNKMAEAVLLGIQILPTSCPENSCKELLTLMKRIEAIENFEIQSLMFQKFIKSGFMKPTEE